MMTERQAQRWEEDARVLFQFMGLDWPYIRPLPCWAETVDPHKIVTIADPHRPYGNQVVLNHIAKNERDAGTVLVTGDAGDYYSRSRFKKKKHEPFSRELRSVFDFLEWLATNWRNALVMIGNHDDRPEKHVGGMLDDAESLIMTESNMLDTLAGFFDNVKIVGHQIPGTAVNLTHIYQHGDIIFTHGELSARQDSAILTRIDNYIANWANHIKLEPWRVLAQSHNHRENFKKTSRGKAWFLLPTASDPYGTGFEYIYSPRMIGEPPDVGYNVFYQVDGETVFNRCQSYVFQVRGGRTLPL